MAAQVHVHTAPAKVIQPDGTILSRHRALIYTGVNGTRLGIINWDGVLVGEYDVDTYQHNGGGAEVTLADGGLVSVAVDVGCGSCGGTMSEGAARALIESQ